MEPVKRWTKSFTEPMFLVMSLIMLGVVYLYADQPLALKIHELHIDQHYPIFNWITNLGKSFAAMVILTLLGFYYRYVHRNKLAELRIWFLWLTLLTTNGFCFGLKMLFGRARPSLLFSDQIFGFFGYHVSGMYHSFPSGHTTQVTTAVVSLSLLYPRQRCWFAMVGIMILATRVLLNRHYLSDVLATFMLVMLEFRLFLFILEEQCPLYLKKLSIKS